GKGKRAERHARHRRGDQEQQAELDQRFRMPVADSLYDPADAPQLCGLAPENAVGGRCAARGRQIPEPARHRDGSRNHHAGPYPPAYQQRHAIVGHRSPRTALAIIWSASPAPRTPKTSRSAFTLAPVRTRAPIREPASTPSITGIESTGSM